MTTVQTLKSKMLAKTEGNPFYGKTNLLNLSQVTVVPTKYQLDAAWNECKADKTLREAFFIILFTFGDITNRQHNLFKGKKVDNGGNSNRKAFMACMQWMIANCKDQYYAFLKTDMFRQYSCLFNVLATQVRTKKGSKNVEQIIDMLEGVDLDMIATYIADTIRKANPVERTIIAKWLVNARTSKRQKYDRKTGEKKGSRELLPATVRIMNKRVELYKLLSEKMSWTVVTHKKNIQFVGLKEFKQEYNGELESVLFSSGKIVEFDAEQFKAWLNTLPSGARYRVRRRLLDGKDKPKGRWISKFGPDFGTLFLEWENFKEVKQEEVRKIEEDVRQGTATEEAKEKLKQVKKEAKVNTGGANLFDMFKDLLAGRANEKEFNLSAQSILDKVKFEVPVLVIADRSGSMGHQGGLPAKMASLATTIAMLKNPSTEIDDVLVTFGDKSDFYSCKAEGITKQNRFMQGSTVKLNSIVDRTKDFLSNLNTVFMITAPRNEGTYFDTVSVAFKKWHDESTSEEEKLYKRELIQSYPVFLVMSDGDLNNGSTATHSMAQFQQNMRQWFGWDGVVVIWNVIDGAGKHHDYFAGLQNVIHYFGFNAGIINTIFTKIHDLDIIDIYTPVKSLYESNRYAPIKQAVL